MLPSDFFVSSMLAMSTSEIFIKRKGQLKLAHPINWNKCRNGSKKMYQQTTNKLPFIFGSFKRDSCRHLRTE